MNCPNSVKLAGLLLVTCGFCSAVTVLVATRMQPSTPARMSVQGRSLSARNPASSGGYESSFSKWQGVKAPDFSVTSLDGQVIKLSDLKGKRVVIDFWATWCGPCVGEIPHFVQLVNETERDELAVVGISKEKPDLLKDFVKNHGINYPIASASDLPPPYNQINAIPTTFFIDRQGTIQRVVVGGRGFDELKANVQKL